MNTNVIFGVKWFIKDNCSFFSFFFVVVVVLIYECVRCLFLFWFFFCTFSLLFWVFNMFILEREKPNHTLCHPTHLSQNGPRDGERWKKWKDPREKL